MSGDFIRPFDRPPHQPDNLVSVQLQSLHQRAPDKTRGTGDGHFHAVTMTAGGNFPSRDTGRLVV